MSDAITNAHVELMDHVEQKLADSISSLDQIVQGIGNAGSTVNDVATDDGNPGNIQTSATSELGQFAEVQNVIKKAEQGGNMGTKARGAGDSVQRNIAQA